MNPADPCHSCRSAAPCHAHHPALGGTPRILSPHDEIAALRLDLARHVAINETLAADLRLCGEVARGEVTKVPLRPGPVLDVWMLAVGGRLRDATAVDRATFDELYASLAKAQDQLANADSAVKESIDEQWRLDERAKSAERERDELAAKLRDVGAEFLAEQGERRALANAVVPACAEVVGLVIQQMIARTARRTEVA